MSIAIHHTILLLLLALLSTVHGIDDLFTSVMDLRELYTAEQELRLELSKYMQYQENKLKQLKKIYNAIPKGDETDVDYIKSPVNSFTILQRFRRYWGSDLIEILKNNNFDTADLISAIEDKRHLFPSDNDIRGGLVGLKRLLDTYRLSISDISNGTLSMRGEHLTADQCFVIGQEAYSIENWGVAAIWLREAARLKEINMNKYDVTITEILDYLAFSEFKLGNTKKAYNISDKLLTYAILDPETSERIEGNIRYYLNFLSEEDINTIDTEEAEDIKSSLPTGTNLFWSMDEFTKYESLCNTPQPLPAKRLKHLKCFYYTHKNNPRLLLSPAKLEVIMDTPRIYSIRGLIKEHENDRIVELGKNKLKRATARSIHSGQFEPADYRIAKSGWLSNKDDPLIFPAVNQRIEDITGLDMSTAEDLQLGVYGIGGHYEPHFDHGRKAEADSFSGEARNRIATVLLYLTDVEKGGSTVFPTAGASVVPQRGDGVFWFNLLSSGESDDMTRHAACPVLMGAKIVCNKWIHEAEQEFRYPCSAKRDQRLRLPEPN